MTRHIGFIFSLHAINNVVSCACGMTSHLWRMKGQFSCILIYLPFVCIHLFRFTLLKYLPAFKSIVVMGGRSIWAWVEEGLFLLVYVHAYRNQSTLPMHALVCIKICVLLVLRQSITIIIIRTNQRNLSNCTQMKSWKHYKAMHAL